MAFNPKLGYDDVENCKEHNWPRCLPGVSCRSIGVVRHEQCNNCLAMRITFTADIRINGGWERFTDVKVVEPHFDTSKTETDIKTT